MRHLRPKYRRGDESSILDRINVVVHKSNNCDTIVSEDMYFRRFTEEIVYRDIWTFAAEQKIFLQGAWLNDESVNYTMTELGDNDGVRISLLASHATTFVIMHIVYRMSPGILFRNGSCDDGPVVTEDGENNIVGWQSGSWKHSISKVTISLVAINESGILFTFVGFPSAPSAPVVNASWSNVTHNIAIYARVHGLPPCSTKLECLTYEKKESPWKRWVQYIVLPIFALIGASIYCCKWKGSGPFQREVSAK